MIGEISLPGEKWGCGIAYVALPNDIERTQYISDCYRNFRISVKMEDGSYENRVPISEDLLSFIEFPLNSKDLGTALVYVTESKHKQPILISRLPKNNQLGDGRENCFQIRRIFNDKLITIDGDVSQGTLGLTVNGGDKQGKLILSVNDDNNDSLLNVDVSGSIFIETTKTTKINNHESFTSIISEKLEDDDVKPSLIIQTRDKTTIGNKEIVLNSQDIGIIHYKGYQIVIDDGGIKIDSLEKPVKIQSGSNVVELNNKGINVKGNKIKIGGNREVLYNKTPGVPVTKIQQIGASKKVTVG